MFNSPSPPASIVLPPPIIGASIFLFFYFRKDKKELDRYWQKMFLSLNAKYLKMFSFCANASEKM